MDVLTEFRYEINITNVVNSISIRGYEKLCQTMREYLIRISDQMSFNQYIPNIPTLTFRITRPTPLSDIAKDEFERFVTPHIKQFTDIDFEITYNIIKPLFYKITICCHKITGMSQAGINYIYTMFIRLRITKNPCYLTTKASDCFRLNFYISSLCVLRDIDIVHIKHMLTWFVEKAIQHTIIILNHYGIENPNINSEKDITLDYEEITEEKYLNKQNMKCDKIMQDKLDLEFIICD